MMTLAILTAQGLQFWYFTNKVGDFTASLHNLTEGHDAIRTEVSTTYQETLNASSEYVRKAFSLKANHVQKELKDFSRKFDEILSTLNMSFGVSKQLVDIQRKVNTFDLEFAGIEETLNAFTADIGASHSILYALSEKLHDVGRALNCTGGCGQFDGIQNELRTLSVNYGNIQTTLNMLNMTSAIFMRSTTTVPEGTVLY